MQVHHPGSGPGAANDLVSHLLRRQGMMAGGWVLRPTGAMAMMILRAARVAMQ